jgi:hypothetical protein
MELDNNSAYCADIPPTGRLSADIDRKQPESSVVGASELPRSEQAEAFAGGFFVKNNANCDSQN